MKQKGIAGLVLAMMLILTAGAAPAAPLTCREIVEQVAVPLALGNDPKAGINRSYSAEELDEIVRVMNENGIAPEENEFVMQCAQNGIGCFEEQVIRAFCEKAYGESETWTPEEQDWYERILVKIGNTEQYTGRVPGPDNMTCEEARTYAVSVLRDAYGQDLPLEDPDIWRPGCQFIQANDEDPRPFWYFWWNPKDMAHGYYSVSFHEGDRSGEADISASIPDWTKPYTGEELMAGFRSVYGWSQDMWPQSVWQEMHEMMQRADLDPAEFDYKEFEGYRLTCYPEPGQNDISREEAIRIAKDALGRDRAALSSAVLTEYGGERSWIVTLVIMSADFTYSQEGTGSWLVSIDSTTGEVKSVGNAYGGKSYIPEAAYEKAGEGEKKDNTDYIGIAVAAVKEQYPELDPLDEAAYTVMDQGLYTHYVEFWPRSIRYGSITVEIDPDGTVREIEADAGPLDGDNLFERYRFVYGYFAGWDQERWIQLEKEMAELPEPLSVDGKALKQTHYPEESSVRIRHEQAKELAIEASGQRTAEAHTCVLVDAEPHPVWILRVITYGGNEDDPVFGIDAETGETVFEERYVIDETPAYVMYSLPETWKKLTGQDEEPIPTPLPDGNPWCMGMDFAPREYWDRAEAFMKANGIMADRLDELEEEWEESFGAYDFWPQEYQALNCLLQITEADLKDPEFEYTPFPDPKKKTQKEIEKAALSAVCSLAGGEKGTDWADKLRAASTLYNDSRNPDDDGKNYGKPVWWVWFYLWTEEDQYWTEMAAYAILDEDGNLMTAGLGEI